jgi:hypothetical protein
LRYRPPTILELPQDELGGASGARRFYLLAVGKRNTPEYPYSVVNEKLASEFGRVIGLRIPEVVLQYLRDSWYAFSYYISETESGETQPEGTASDIAAFYEANPTELHGMICFDLFLCNNDRKPDNLVIGEDGNVWLIDHANALFYRRTGRIKPGIPRLAAIARNLEVMFDKPHAFLEALVSWEDIDKWCERISQIPSYFIRARVEDLPGEVLTQEEREFLIKFLELRKSHMKEIIQSNQSLFPALRDRGDKES